MNNPPLIIEVGSYITKIGFGGDSLPKFILPMAKLYNSMTSDSKEVDSLIWRDSIDYKYLVDPQNFNKILSILFYEKPKIDPTQQSLLITGTFLHWLENPASILEILFEEHKVNSLFVLNPATASLAAVNPVTGVVIDLGHSTSTIAAVSNRILQIPITELQFGGRRATTHIQNRLRNHEISIPSQFVNPLKERHSRFFSEEEEVKMKLEGFETFNVKNIKINYESIEYDVKNYNFYFGVETFFDPHIVSSEDPKPSESLSKTIFNCEPGIRENLWSNILICGGSSQIPGLVDRFNFELTNYLESSKIQPNLTLASNPSNLCWIGASKMSIEPDFQTKWISRNEYLEKGKDVLNSLI